MHILTYLFFKYSNTKMGNPLKGQSLNIEGKRNRLSELGVVAHGCNASIPEAEVRVL